VSGTFLHDEGALGGEVEVLAGGHAGEADPALVVLHVGG